MPALHVASYPYLVYLPQIAADHLQMYALEGVEVEHSYHVQPLEEVLRKAERPIDVIVENIWLSLRSWSRVDRLVPISHMSQQTKWVVAAREAQPDFRWSRLESQSIVFPCDSPTVWAAFRQVLADAGMSLDRLQLVVGFKTPAQAHDEFAAGLGDYLVTDLDLVEAAGLQEVGAMADSLGPVPWSVLCSSPRTVESRYAELVAFRRAIGRALQWVNATSASEIADALREKFDRMDRIGMLDHSTRVTVIQRYKSLGEGEWPSTPALVRSNVRHWQEILLRWGLLTRPAPLDEVLAFNDAQSGAGVVGQGVGS
jgi:ABC-type nitrate/sulfonate/bicarbonate transport system substrate-binding protein